MAADRLRPISDQLYAADPSPRSTRDASAQQGHSMSSGMLMGSEAREPEVLRLASENGGDAKSLPAATPFASDRRAYNQNSSDAELLDSRHLRVTAGSGTASFNFSALGSLSACSAPSAALTGPERNMTSQASDKRSGRLLWPVRRDLQQSQGASAVAAPPPSPLTVARPETDLLGRPLPPVPPPQDPFAQAVSQQPSLVTAPRGRFSSAAGIKSLNLAAFAAASRREDDTQSTWASTLFSRMVDTSGDTAPEVGPTPQREQDGSAMRPAGTPQSAAAGSRREQVPLRRTSTEPEGLAQLAARIDALEAELKVELPTTPNRTYSPSLVASSESSSPARAARTRLLAQQAIDPSSAGGASRSSLAARRSAQRLPPLLPTSVTTGSPFLAPPSDHSSPSVSSLSIRSVPLPPIERGEDGFYRLPVSPHKVAKRAPFDDATNLSFPLPPHLDLMSPALKSAAASSFEGSQATPITPSTYNSPASPPRRSPPPALPEFVSVFLEPRSSSERATEAEQDDDASEDDLVGGTYPPDRGRSHLRRAESLSSAIVPPLALRYSLRQRTPSRPGIPKTRHDEHARSLSDKAASSPADEKVKWTVRAAPGWSLRAEKREAEDNGTVRAVGGGTWRRLRDSRLVRLGAAALVFAALLLVVGLAVGLTRSRNAVAFAQCDCLNGGKVRVTAAGDCVCQCRGRLGGTSCHLDGTCLDGLAQGVVDTAARASSLWQPTINTTRLTTSLRLYFDEPLSTSTDCSDQLDLLAIPNFSFSRFPSRVNWLEAALLHIFAASESNSTVVRFRLFASRLDYSLFGDEPATKPNSNYQIMPAGYVWDLATLERSVPPVSWNATVGSSAASTLTPASLLVLDNITSNAIAASRQRTTALAHFWNDTLGLSTSQLDLFRAAVQSAEVILPFDATTLVKGAYVNPALFPPITACMSGLDVASRVGIDSFEATVLGLPSITEGTGSCTVS